MMLGFTIGVAVLVGVYLMFGGIFIRNHTISKYSMEEEKRKAKEDAIHQKDMALCRPEINDYFKFIGSAEWKNMSLKEQTEIRAIQLKELDEIE